MRNNSPKSNIYSKECISNTETPAQPTKIFKNRRNKKYSIFFAGSVYLPFQKRNLMILSRCLNLVTDFSIHRKDRNRHGGGIMLYVRSNIPHMRRIDLEPEPIKCCGTEMVIIETRLYKTEK